MGADIHLFIETRKSKIEAWHLAPPTWPCPECSSDQDEVIMRKVLSNDYEHCYWCDGKGHTTYNTRNYALFGQLAGVRCDVVPFIDPRGWPKDISCELQTYRSYEDREDRDVMYEKYKTYPGDHTPHYYTLEELLSFEIDNKFISYTNGTFSYRDLAKDFWNSFVPYLQTLGEPENVRIVFNFDS